MYAKKASDVCQQTHNSTCVFAQGKRTKLVYTWNKTTLNENEKPSSASLFLSSTPVKKGGGWYYAKSEFKMKRQPHWPLCPLTIFGLLFPRRQDSLGRLCYWGKTAREKYETSVPDMDQTDRGLIKVKKKEARNAI